LAPTTREPADARLADRACMGMALLVSVALWLPRLHGPIDLRYDGGAYYILGTALAEGRGYRLLNEPGEIEAVQYPPLLPLIVAAHQKVLGTSDPVVVGCWLRGSFFLLSVGYALATYLLARLFLPAGTALLSSLLCSLCLYTYFLSDLCFAEIPFALTTTLFVLANRARGRLPGLLAALLGIAGFLLRTMGLALLAAWVVESLLARRLRQAALRGVVALLPVLLWQAHIERVRSGPEYRAPAYAYQRAPYQYYNVSYIENVALVDPFRPERGIASRLDLRARALDNLRSLPARLGEAVSAPQRFWEWSLYLLGGARGRGAGARGFMLVLGCLVLVSLVRLIARGERLIPLYLLASLGLICMTPWPEQFTRYLAPLAPFLTLVLVIGLADWRGRFAKTGTTTRTLGTLSAAAILAVVLGLQIFTASMTFGRFHPAVTYVDGQGRVVRGRLFFRDKTWASFDNGLAWLRSNARPGETVATSAPHLAYLRTGLKAVMPPLEADTETAQRLLDSVPVRYVIVDDLEFTDMSRRYAAPAVVAHADLWTPVYRGKGALRIYRRMD
jgi:hypothetical protein